MSATLCQRQVRLLIFWNGSEMAADGSQNQWGFFSVFSFYSLPYSWKKPLNFKSLWILFSMSWLLLTCNAALLPSHSTHSFKAYFPNKGADGTTKCIERSSSVTWLFLGCIDHNTLCPPHKSMLPVACVPARHSLLSSVCSCLTCEFGVCCCTFLPRKTGRITLRENMVST